MAVMTELVVPGDQFELGRPLQHVAPVQVTIERTVPANNRPLPYVWVDTADHTGLRQHVQADRAVEAFEMVHQVDQQGLYQISWSAETDLFLDCLRRTETVVLGVTGSATGWLFELRFDSRDELSQFQEVSLDRDISLSVERVNNSGVSDPPKRQLTDPQRETIELALERGYFDVPRKTTMVELAEELHVSDQAVSARIRRASKKLTQQLVRSESAERTTTAETTGQ